MLRPYIKNMKTKFLIFTLTFTFLANLAWAKPRCVPARENPAKQLAYALCERITECNPELSLYQCVNGVYFERQLGEDFIENGDEEVGENYSLRQLSRDYDHGNYCVVEPNFHACLNFIDDLTCHGEEEVTVEAGYAPRDPRNFGNVENLVEGACEGVFF